MLLVCFLLVIIIVESFYIVRLRADRNWLREYITKLDGIAERALDAYDSIKADKFYMTVVKTARENYN
jgi:hypothetical protein